MVFICCFILIVVAIIGKYKATVTIDKELPPARDVSQSVCTYQEISSPNYHKLVLGGPSLNYSSSYVHIDLEVVLHWCFCSLSQENGVLYNYTNLVCEGPRSLIWIAVLYGYIIITHLVAVLLAFLTRKVEIKALNDYKYISVITYISFFILVTMIFSAVFLGDFLNADGAVFSSLLFTFSTVVLALAFIPKVRMIMGE